MQICLQQGHGRPVGGGAREPVPHHLSPPTPAGLFCVTGLKSAASSNTLIVQASSSEIIPFRARSASYCSLFVRYHRDCRDCHFLHCINVNMRVKRVFARNSRLIHEELPYVVLFVVRVNLRSRVSHVTRHINTPHVTRHTSPAQPPPPSACALVEHGT